jgi:tetratricopeptide (TPR) repeat protein
MVKETGSDAAEGHAEGEAVPGAGAAERPFSEMISRWLDEGDRIHEKVPAIGDLGVEFTGANEGRLRSLIAAGRSGALRHRGLIAAAALLSLIVAGVSFAGARRDRRRAPPVAVVAAHASAPVAAAAPASAPVVAAPPAPPPSVPASVVVAPAPPASSTPEPSPLGACQLALQKQRSRDALGTCGSAVASAPRSAEALILLARADLLAGRQGETLRLARRAAVANPRQADAYLLIGSVEQTEGHKQDARIAYERYLALAPHGTHAADVRVILRRL